MNTKKSSPLGAADELVVNQSPRPAVPLGWLSALLTHLYQNHPGLLLTIGYIFLTGVGMSYEFQLGLKFGLNIFDYSDATDFVLVALRNPPLLTFTVLSIAIIRNIHRVHVRSLARSTAYRGFTERMIRWRGYALLERILVISVIVAYFGVVSNLQAMTNAARIKSGQARTITLEMIYENSLDPSLRGPKRYVPLAYMSRYLLLYNPANNRTEIVPVNNVSSITVAAARKTP